MTLLVTRPRRSLAMYPALGMPVTSGAPVDIEETAEAFRIELDLPGVAPDDVEIELRDNEIRVFGTLGERRRDGTLRHQARHRGEFEYLVALPADVAADRVTADLDGGVLTIVAPKLREQQARRISLQGRASDGPSGSRSEGRSEDRLEGRSEVRSEGRSEGRSDSRSDGGASVPSGTLDTPAAHAKQMKEGQPRPGPASQQVGSTGVGSTGQVGRSPAA